MVLAVAPKETEVEPIVTDEFANFALVTTPFAIVVLTVPAVVVTSPVKAGIFVAEIVPDSRATGTVPAVIEPVTSTE